MKYGATFACLRKEKGYTQAEVAEYINRLSHKPCSFKVVSHWENDVSSPTIEQFLLLCEYYGIKDIQHTFRKTYSKLSDSSRLNTLGKARVEEYISILSSNPQFSESDSTDFISPPKKVIKLYDTPVAAGVGTFLDSDCFSELDVDETVPNDADFAVRVSGDSMEPRFVDSQVIFIKEQKILEIGEIGIFALNGDSYIKKLGQGKLVSLNPRYEPIKIHEYDSLHVFGKVVG